METARSQWHDWPSWFRAVGVPMPHKARVLDFSSYAMLVNAALAGQGVCLCWDGVLDRFLEAGAELGAAHVICAPYYEDLVRLAENLTAFADIAAA